MRPLIVALIFALIFLSSCYLAAKGYRGVATSRSEGYGEYLPDHMLADPERQLHLLVQSGRYRPGRDSRKCPVALGDDGQRPSGRTEPLDQRIKALGAHEHQILRVTTLEDHIRILQSGEDTGLLVDQRRESEGPSSHAAMAPGLRK